MFQALSRRLLSDRTGNFGMLTALLLVPIVALGGIAIDTTRAFDVRNTLDGIADAAALGAMAPASAARTALSKTGISAAIAAGEQESLALFQAQIDPRLASFGAKAKTSMIYQDGTMKLSIHYSAELSTTLLRIMGYKSVKVAGVSKAELRPEQYNDFHVLIDNSPSMGLGATFEDIRIMEAATAKLNPEEPCGFACHATNMPAYRQVVEDSGAKTRIDVVRTALDTMFISMQRATHVPGQQKMALYTFGAQAQKHKLTNVTKLTTDITQLRLGAHSVVLMETPRKWYNYAALSPIDRLISDLVPQVGKGGSGRSVTDRRKVVMLVTDGVTDTRKPDKCSGPLFFNERCMEPLDVAACTELKKNNVQVAVLYTTYLPLPNDDFWNEWISPFQERIDDHMRECASPGLFFEVGLKDGIDEAMNALFRQLLATARILS